MSDHTVPDEGAKTCNTCREPKSRDDFHRDKNGRYGRSSRCKACAKRAANEWYARKSAEDGFREQRKERFARAMKKWRAANPDAGRKYSRRYREENRALFAERERRYRQANPERVREKNRRRRARLLDAFVAHVDIDEILLRDQGICQICRREIDLGLTWPDPLSLTLDHRVPLARGGTHEPRNVQVAHARCNSRKSDRPMVEISS